MSSKYTRKIFHRGRIDHFVAGVTYLQFSIQVCYSATLSEMDFSSLLWLSAEKEHFSSCNLELWPMTLTHELCDNARWPSWHLYWTKTWPRKDQYEPLCQISSLHQRFFGSKVIAGTRRNIQTQTHCRPTAPPEPQWFVLIQRGAGTGSSRGSIDPLKGVDWPL